MVRCSALPRQARRPVAVKSDALPDLAVSGETHAHDHHRARRRLRHRPDQRRSRRPQTTWIAALRAARTACPVNYRAGLFALVLCQHLRIAGLST
jgi:hypothetical protein